MSSNAQTSKFIDRAFYNKTLTEFNVSFSKSNQKQYVQDALLEKKDLVAQVLRNKGTVMICGSISMKNSVIKTLEYISQKTLKCPISEFEKNNQIITDCY